MSLKHPHAACTTPPQHKFVASLCRVPSRNHIERRKVEPRSVLLGLVVASFVPFLPTLPAQTTPPQNKTGSSVPAKSAPASSNSAASPAFDVASIRPNNTDHSGNSHMYYSPADSHFRAINVTVFQLIQFAYALPDARILNAPDWLKASQYDIQAESENTVDDEMHALPYETAKLRKQRMVQSLLADRFHLAAHLETRVLPVYALIVAPKGPLFSPVPDGAKHYDSTTRSGIVTITITNSSSAISDLAEILTRPAGRIVIDKTGLHGTYSISLKFAPDDFHVPMRDAVANSPLPDSESAPSLFTALREQLGLELKSEKAPINVLVLDHIEAPTEN
ncbi:MAG: TIGR03435 family protein [Terracidiphilus sp.]